MDVSEQIGRNYNHYPNTAIALSSIAYDAMAQITAETRSQTGLDVVWGPAELQHDDGISYSRAFIARDPATDEYFAVIRGTNFDSLSSWLKQDFDLDVACRFADLPGHPPGAPDDALISQGTFNGMSDLLKLRDPATQSTMVEYLLRQKPRWLYVTGHSLGGTLTPTLFAYLNAMVYGPGPTSNMALWSFAGLTAGGTGFNAYFNSILPNHDGFLWRIHNSLDIAPLCWWSFGGIESIYSAQDLHWDFVEKDLVRDLFADAAKPGIGYAHPQDGLLLPGTFDDSIVDDDLWAAQALQQHHPATYQAMVSAYYPLPPKSA